MKTKLIVLIALLCASTAQATELTVHDQELNQKSVVVEVPCIFGVGCQYYQKMIWQGGRSVGESDTMHAELLRANITASITQVDDNPPKTDLKITTTFNTGWVF